MTKGIYTLEALADMLSLRRGVDRATLCNMAATEITDLRSKLTTTLAERDEARERVKVLESSLRVAKTVREANNKAAWQQGAEAFRGAAIKEAEQYQIVICRSSHDDTRDGVATAIADDIRALPVPERKEG